MSESSSANIQNPDHNLQFKNFDVWINEPLNRWEKDKLRSSKIFSIANVIYEWIEYYEYSLNCNLDSFVNKIATMAYYIDSEFFYDPTVTLMFGTPKHRNLPKDWNEYNYVFDSDFWYDLKHIFEPTVSIDSSMLFYSDQASEYFWSALPEYIYKLLDIANSPYVQAYDARDKQIDDDYINAMIEDGLLFIDKKGRVLTVNKNDHYKDREENY